MMSVGCTGIEQHSQSGSQVMRMNSLSKVVVGATLWICSAGAGAGDVEIVKTEFRGDGARSWRVDVTLLHGDTGWDHYADAWRVVTEDGAVLGTRTLYHPHENEQPFTRSLGDVKVPDGVNRVYVEAHDSVHGWSPDRVAVDLDKPSGPRFEVSR